MCVMPHERKKLPLPGTVSCRLSNPCLRSSVFSFLFCKDRVPNNLSGLEPSSLRAPAVPTRAQFSTDSPQPWGTPAPNPRRQAKRLSTSTPTPIPPPERVCTPRTAATRLPPRLRLLPLKRRTPRRKRRRRRTRKKVHSLRGVTRVLAAFASPWSPCCALATRVLSC